MPYAEDVVDAEAVLAGADAEVADAVRALLGQFPFTLGVDYVGDSIVKARALANPSPYADPGHLGDKVVARLRFGF